MNGILGKISNRLVVIKLENLLKNHDLIARVAWKYYNEGMTQQEIADEFGVSRFKIMNILSEARDKGLIKIQFLSPIFNCLSIESELKEKYNLSDVVVIPTPCNSSDLKKVLGIAGSNYLQNHIKPGDKIGTAWGGTVFEVAKYFPPMKVENVTIVLLLGGLTSESVSLNPYDVAQKIAEKLGALCYYIFSPAIVDSEEICKAILSDRKIQSALEMANSVNKALVGIGEVSDEAALIKTNYISKDKMAKLRKKGAVGDILGRFFDINGSPVRSDLSNRIIGLDLEKVRNIDTVIGVAGGKKKVKSIYGALKGNYLDVLITDEDTAKKLLAME